MSKLLKLLIIAAFFNCISWILLIPIWQYPDEQAHFAQVQDIAEIGRVPVGVPDTSNEILLSEKILETERNDLGNNKFTYHPEYKIQYADSLYGPKEREIIDIDKSERQNLVKNEATFNPPLYYFMAATFYKAFSFGNLIDRVFAVRLMSAIIFLLTIFLAYNIGRLVFGKDQVFAVVLASVVAFKPMLVFSSTGVLPDTLTNLLFTIVIFFSLKIVESGLKPIFIIALFILIILGVQTRQQFLIVLLIISLPVIYKLKMDIKVLKRTGFLIAALVLFFFWAIFFETGIPFFTNFKIPEGSIITDNRNITLSSFVDYVVKSSQLTVNEIFPWYWGVYKWLSLTLPLEIYRVFKIIILISGAGMILKLSKDMKRHKFEKETLILAILLVWSFLYYLAFLIWDYLFRQRYGYSFGMQGRYFFPLVVVHLALLLLGLREFTKIFFAKYLKPLVISLNVAMILFNDYTLMFVSSSYYNTLGLDIFIKQVSQYKPQIFKGYPILLIAVFAIFAQLFYLVLLFRYIYRRNVEI